MWSATAPDLLHATLDVGVEALAFRQVALPGEHGFRGLGRELPARLRCAGLHNHRPSLNWARDVERTTHGEVFAL